jgi:hypothetical protein
MTDENVVFINNKLKEIQTIEERVCAIKKQLSVNETFDRKRCYISVDNMCYYLAPDTAESILNYLMEISEAKITKLKSEIKDIL